jgi:glycyl-tRNA synthetase alpha chain
MDGMEITQFTYFQQVGGIDLAPISGEITYGLDRIAMAIQGTKSVQELKYASDGRGGFLSWADLWLMNEVEFSRYNFEEANVEQLFAMFAMWEGEAQRLLGKALVMPGYDAVVKCSHLFNLLDARGAISVSERVGYIGRVRKLARAAAVAYLAKREEMGFPMLPKALPAEAAS